MGEPGAVRHRRGAATGRGPTLTAVLVLVLVAALLVSCGGDRTPLAARDGITGADARVQLPHGQVTLTVSAAGPVDEDDLAGSGAPDGEYVGVDWDWEPGAGVPGGLSGFLIADGATTGVSVEVDGEEHDLGPVEAPEPTYVPVPEGTGAADVTVSVTLDGVTQSVRGDGSGLAAGAAEPLYSLPDRATPARCRAGLTPARLEGDLECGASTVRLPYLTDLGWAEEGRSWLVVGLSVGLRAYRDGDEETTVHGQEERIRVDGKEPVAVLQDSAPSGAGLSTQNAFDVPDDDPVVVEFTRSVRPPTDAGDPVAVEGTVHEGRRAR